jgi:competence protein ComEC
MRPLVVWAVAFSLGIAARAQGISLLSIVGASAGAAVILLVIARRWPPGTSSSRAASRRLLVCAVCACIAGGGRAALDNQSVDSKMGELAGSLETDRPVPWSGIVVSAPEPARAGCRIRVRATRIGGHGVQALVALSLAAGLSDVLPGDRIELRSKLHVPRGTANPGVPDPELQLRAAGIELLTGVGSAADLRRVRPPAGEAGRGWSTLDAWCWWLRRAAVARRALGAALDRRVVGAPGLFLHTAVLGERRQADVRVEDGFRAAGATHVLSVSGLHLAVVAMALFSALRAFLRRVPRLALVASPAGLAAACTIPAVWFYTALTGGAIATVRAACMMTVGFGAHLVARRSSTVVSVALTALLLTIVQPDVIFDVSYQLSICSVLALALWLRRGDRPARVGGGGMSGLAARALRAAGRGVRGLASATLVAGTLTGPLVAHHFGEVTPAAPLGNLVLVPLVESVVVPVGLVGSALGAFLGDSASRAPLAIAGWTAHLVLSIAELFRRYAPVLLTRAPNAGETLILSLAGGLAVHACARLDWRVDTGRRLALPDIIRLRLRLRLRLPLPSPQPGARRKLALALLGVAAGFSSLAARDVARRRRADLVVTFLDVGQGDAAVVEFPGGHTMLIDAGGTYDGAFDPGARIVEPFLRGAGILRLDLVALSHPHPDHMGGLHRVLQRFEVNALWTSGDDGHNPDYRTLLGEAAARRIPTPVPARCALGDGGAPALVEPLGPFVTDPGGRERIGPPEGASVNDASLVLRVARAGRAVLFSGDLEGPGEGELCGRVEAGQTIAADVLKVPHHGSRTSSSEELLSAVRPQVAVISLGWLNRFHFPRPEVIERYRRRGIRILRTDQVGAITLTIGPGGELDLDCQRGCDSPAPAR